MNTLTLSPILALIIVVLVSLTACQTAPPAAPSTITILHTNDIHGALDNAPRLTTLINQGRAAAGKDNLLLLDAGDVFTGTLYSTLFQGEAEAWFMNHDGYDAMTIGNHDFDRGPQGLADFIKRLNFPVVSSNMDFKNISPLKTLIKPYLIVQKSGSRFGLFGLITGRTAELSSSGPDVIFNDEIASAKTTVAVLKDQGINKIIVLSHLGWEADLKLAAAVPGLDVIVGGHTHTLPSEYPTVIKDGSNPTLIVQGGAQSQYLGQLDIVFNQDGVIQNWTGSQLLRIDDKIVPEAAGAAKIAEYQKAIGAYTQNIIGKTSVTLDGDRSRNRLQETNLGDLIADSMLEKAGRVQAVVALISGGGIRASVPSGDISLGSVLEILPFHNFLVALDITGAQLMNALENGVSQVEAADGRFPQISGFQFVWNPGAAPGSRIQSVEIQTTTGFKPLDLAATYRLVTTNFLAAGGDGYSVLKEGRGLITLGDVDSEVLTEYVRSHSPLNPAIEGRIKTGGP
jgi:2',3'-cyclic-nucleotide 2'-phosphodiesterase (5'-nucleotidase family)